MIYRLVIGDDSQFAEFGKQLSYTFDRDRPNPQKLQVFRPEKRNRLIIQQPSIFVTCKTIRAEGLPVFFQLRYFHFVVNEGMLTLKMLLRWIGSLSTAERSNIRTLEIVFLETFHMEWVMFLNDLIEPLRPDAGIWLNTALTCDAQKFQAIKATWDVLKPKARKLNFHKSIGWSSSPNAKFSGCCTMQAFESEGPIWPVAATLTFEDQT